MRWLAVAGWAGAALWSLLRFQATGNSVGLVLLVLSLALAGSMAVGGGLARAASFVGIVVAAFMTLGFSLALAQGLVENALGAFCMIALAVIGYRAARPSEDF